MQSSKKVELPCYSGQYGSVITKKQAREAVVRGMVLTSAGHR